MSFNLLFRVLINVAAPLLASSSSSIYIIPSSLHAQSNAVFFCRGNSTSLSWLDPKGIIIVDSARTKVTNFGHESELNITMLLASDSGTYTCTDGTSQAFTYLVVRVYPRITYAPAVQNFTEGQQACIVCTVDLGNPPAYSNVQWMGPTSPNLTPVLNTTTCVCIQNITARDAGLYQYVVNVNGGTSIKQSIQVHVLPSPHPDPPTDSSSPLVAMTTSGPTSGPSSTSLFFLLGCTVHVPPTSSQKTTLLPGKEQEEDLWQIHILVVHGSKCDPTLADLITQHIRNYATGNCSCTVAIINDTYTCLDDTRGVYSFKLAGPSAQTLIQVLLASNALGLTPELPMCLRVGEASREQPYIVTAVCALCTAILSLACVGGMVCFLVQRRRLKLSNIEKTGAATLSDRVQYWRCNTSHQGTPPHSHAGTLPPPHQGTPPHPHQGTPPHPHQGTPPHPHQGTPPHPHQGTPPHSLGGSCEDFVHPCVTTNTYASSGSAS